MTMTGSRSARVAHALLQSIAQGALKPGDTIDVAQWCRRHRVSRTVVREALAELAGKGLVSARPGIDTSVAERPSWQLLDPMLMQAGLGHRPDLMRDAAALRRMLEPTLAAQAALHASRIERTALLLTLRRLAGAVGVGSVPAQAAHDAALHAAIARACGNPLLRTIDRALEPSRRLHYARWRHNERHDAGRERGSERLLDVQTRLTLAIVRAQPTAARHWAEQLTVPPAVRSLGPSLGGPENRSRQTLQGTAATQAYVSGESAELDSPEGPATVPMPAWASQA